jgi:predicted dehydrogenase
MAMVREIEASDRLVAVNLFNRNAWYHKEIQQSIADEIGDLAVIRICHMTPGHMPLEGYDPEGPPFHDCGMHYVDVAKSEYQSWPRKGYGRGVTKTRGGCRPAARSPTE